MGASQSGMIGGRSEGSSVSFDDLKDILRRNDSILISTLPETMQDCLIRGTLPSIGEEDAINKILEDRSKGLWSIVIYGRNCLDSTVERKHAQLMKAGFKKVYVYVGGMFEWVLLQETYGEDNFPTTRVCTNILRYCPSSGHKHLFASRGQSSSVSSSVLDVVNRREESEGRVGVMDVLAKVIG